ncbi:MAG TPA: NADP-dependent oxidoreductase [Kofleriaceae bacterium]|nr:NADP-dependent oxidoreductase [Kofleriaceae bacterium]
MRSVVAKRYGGPEMLDLVERDEPSVGARDVLIDVKAASLNPLDFKIRDGKTKLVLPLKPPIALGCDVAGVVTAVGGSVTRFKVGDDVFARLEKMRMGGLSERVAADENVVAMKPARVSFVEAAAIPLAALTALQAFREVAAVQPGQRVLIHAGAGGVGSLAIQIAKVLGVHVITTTSAKNADFVKSLGADEVVDYTHERVVDRVRDVDAVFDTLGTTEIESLAVVKRGGVVVGIGGLPDGAFAREWLPWWTPPAIWMMTRKRRAAAARHGARFVYWFMRPDGEQLAELARWIDDGKLQPIVHKEYPLAEFREAFAELERGRSRGKIVLTF